LISFSAASRGEQIIKTEKIDTERKTKDFLILFIQASFKKIKKLGMIKA
jgi:hypothetical protein